MIDHALVFNVPASGDRMAYLATAIGLTDTSAEGFLDWLSALKRDIGVPATLSAQGLDRTLTGWLTDLATADACHANNPRPVSADDFETIFAAAFG
jgi:alcohol dehydrogenase class IV